jgi:S-adenosyl-L-methionine hydrolase (adenosine-forming)
MSQPPPIITLLTDFGAQDSFVGTMKGVILSLCPRARLVDLTHEVTPGDVRAGSFALWTAVPYFPPGTVHLAVVDPGVGSARRPLVLRTVSALFVGPDNGLLWPAAARDGAPEAWEIDRTTWERPLSATFHGRDLFAPAAARLAAGEPPEAFCHPFTDPLRLNWPPPQRQGRKIVGEVLAIDRFGNGITNLTPADLGTPSQGQATFTAAGRTIEGPASHYAWVPAGDLVVVLGSAGLYEIAMNQGSAAVALGLRVGSPVEVELRLPSDASPTERDVPRPRRGDP